MTLASIYEEAHADLFPLHLFVEGWAWKLKDKAGADMQSNALVFRNRGVQWITDDAEQTRVAKALLKKIMGESFEKVRDTTSALLDKMQSLSTKLEKTDFSKLSDSELADIYTGYCNQVVELNSYGTLVTLMEMGHESIATQACYEYLAQKARQKKLDGEVALAVPALCAPVHGTFLREKKIGVLTAALHGKVTSSWTKEKLLARAKELHEKYSWVSYGYVGPEMSLHVFEKQIEAEMDKDFEQIKKEISQANGEDAVTAAKQRELEEKFALDDYGKRLFEMARTFAFQKELRKQALYRSFYALLPLRKEICKRAGVTLAQLSYSMPQEISLLLAGKLDAGILNERLKLCVYMPFQKQILVGKQAEEFIKKIKLSGVDSSVKELHGQSAFCGKTVEAIARIVLNAHDLHKLNKGEVMVSPATSPIMVPAMKDAGAIVTDQGGLTCHASIVSRELRIPCVIGTKIATKAIKDGQKVRVDSLQGLVTLL